MKKKVSKQNVDFHSSEAMPEGHVDRVSGDERLRMVASILALAVIRRKVRKGPKSISEESSPVFGEGLDLFGEQGHSFMATRPETNIRSCK